MHQGKQICYAWNRNTNGCSSICPTGRLHVCEYCLQNHRSIECTKKPKQEGGSIGSGTNKAKK
eukprot:2291868-Amphidinium_carterae.1